MNISHLCSSCFNMPSIPPLEMDEPVYQSPYPKTYQFESTAWKAAKVVLSVIFFPLFLIYYGLHRLMIYILCHSAYTVPPEIDSVRKALLETECETHQIRRIAFKTPDGVQLDGVLAESKINPKKVVVYIGGINCKYETMQDHWLQLGAITGVSILAFNQRGVVASSGSPSFETDHLDAYAALRYVIDELKIAPNDVLVFGHSMGGSSGARAAAYLQEDYNDDPDVKIAYAGDRTFINLPTTAYYLPEVGKQLPETGRAVLHPIVGQISSLTCQITTGSIFNTVEALELVKGRKIAFYHLDDEIIHPNASLGFQMKDDHNFEVINLENEESYPTPHMGIFSTGAVYELVADVLGVKPSQ